MPEHFFHSLFISLALILAIIIWFWDKINSHLHIQKKYHKISFIPIFLTLIILFQALSINLAYQHQSSDPNSQHPCCMVTTLITPAPLIIKTPSPEINSSPKKLVTLKSKTPFYSFNTRSPPLS